MAHVWFWILMWLLVTVGLVWDAVLESRERGGTKRPMVVVVPVFASKAAIYTGSTAIAMELLRILLT